MKKILTGDGMLGGETAYKRHANDFYLTPWGLCEAVAKWAAYNCNPVRLSAVPKILDLGAGTGRWGKAFKAEKNCVLMGVESNSALSAPLEYDSWISGSFLEVSPTHLSSFDCVVGNPPFYLLSGRQLTPFFTRITAARSAVLLLPLSTLTSKGRAPWMFERTLRRVLLLDRISWMPKGHLYAGAVNDKNYALFYFDQEYKGNPVVSRFPIHWENDHKYNGRFAAEQTWDDIKTLGLYDSLGAE